MQLDWFWILVLLWMAWRIDRLDARVKKLEVEANREQQGGTGCP